MQKKKTKLTRRERLVAEQAVSPPASAVEEVGTGFFGTFSGLDALAGLGLGFMVVVCYFPALSAGFVWDDTAFANESVIHRWSGLWNIWFSPADIRRNEGHYWPLVYTTFWLEHKLWGLAPLGYHVVNLLLHLVNTVLVWRLLLTLGIHGAWTVAAVFAVHPLHVESVAWIIERKDLLSALFYLGAALAWVRFTEAPARGRYLLALGLYTAALLSKSIAVTLPATLVIWHWWKRGAVTATDWMRLAPFFVVGVGITAADFAFYSTNESLSLGYSAAERVLIAARALWFYAGKLLWPVDLAVIYPPWEVRAGDLLGWAYVAAALSAAALLWLLRNRIGRGPLVAAAFFAVTLSPVLGFVDYGYMQFSFVADRHQYLAGLGVMALLVGGTAYVGRRLPGALRPGATGAFVVVLAVLGTLTWQQAGIYRDEITFFSHVVSFNPQARGAHHNLGGALFGANRLEEARAAFLVAAEQSPDNAEVHAGLGGALLQMQRFDEAGASLSRALELNPRNRTARQNLAELRRMQGRYEESVEWYRKVLAKDPLNSAAHTNLGFALFEWKRYQEAVESMDRALELAPESPKVLDLYLLTGRALHALGRLDEAEQRFLRAVGNDPDDPAPLIDLSGLRFAQQRIDEANDYLRQAQELAHGNTAALQVVAEAFRNRGRYDKALEAYRAVLALDPEFAMAHAGMGVALFRLERYEEAIESLDRSLSLHSIPPTATARLVLMGRAAQALGRLDAAVAHYERAVEIDPRNPDALDHLAAARFEHTRYQEALDLYRTLREVRPDDAQVHAKIGVVLHSLGRPAEALRNFERALSLDPSLEMARTGLEEARKILRQRGR